MWWPHSDPSPQRHQLYTSLHHSHNKIKTPRANIHLISEYCCNNYFRHCIELSPHKTNSKHSSHSVNQVPSCALWLWRRRNKLYHFWDRASRHDDRGSNAENRIMMEASTLDVLDRRLMSLLSDHHMISLTYWPCWNRLNQGMKPFDAWFSILDDEETLPPCANGSSSRLQVAIRTHPHLGKHCINYRWLILSPPSGPSATSHMNCLLIT